MIDLHSHSTASDGTLTPTELINLGLKKKLTALALTDHDTLDGLEEAQKAALNTSLKFIPGIELQIEFPSGEFHLLGLGLDQQNSKALRKTLLDLQIQREKRNREIVRLMQKDGIVVTLQDIENLAGGNIVARPHFARFLLEQKRVKTMQEAFEEFLGHGKAYYVPKKALDLEKGLELIHQANGQAILAHPLSLYLSWGKLEEILPTWKEMGLDGIEAWHSGAKQGQAERLQALAENYNLKVTGGSDYHGKNRLDRQLGYGAGKLRIPDKLLDPLFS